VVLPDDTAWLESRDRRHNYVPFSGHHGLSELIFQVATSKDFVYTVWTSSKGRPDCACPQSLVVVRLPLVSSDEILSCESAATMIHLTRYNSY
jgi:hypothetical protein